MPPTQFKSARLKGFRGPRFYARTEELAKTYLLTPEDHVWMHLTALHMPTEDLRAVILPETSDGYDWFVGLHYRMEDVPGLRIRREIMVLLPHQDDLGTRAIAVYLKGPVTEYDVDITLQLLNGAIKDHLHSTQH